MGTTADKLNKVLQTKEAIRTAINNKGGILTTSDKFSDYATAIDNIQSGSTNESITITQNGTYTAPEGVGYSPINVNVPSKEEETKSITITENGTTTILPTSGKVLSKVDIVANVPQTSMGTLLKDFLTVRNCNSLFSDKNELTTDQLNNIISYSDTSNVTNMRYMFYRCYNLTTIPQLDTRSVTTMESMLQGCRHLTSIPQLDTSNVTNMESMFNMYYENGSYGNLYTLKIPSLNTSNVTNMKNMFYWCNLVYSIPQLDTSKVTNMSQMFYSCYNLKTIPQLDTGKVTNMYAMFEDCYNLTTIPQLDISKVTDTSSMFKGCRNLKSVPQLDTSKVTDMRMMFENCFNLTTIDITHMKITSTSNSYHFTYCCYSLIKLVIRNIDTIPTLDSDAFMHCFHFYGTADSTYNPEGLKDGRIYVPANKVEELKVATNWSVFADIIMAVDYMNGEHISKIYINNNQLKLNTPKKVEIYLNEFTNIPTVDITVSNESIAQINNTNITTEKITFDINALGTEGNATITVNISGDYNKTLTTEVFYTPPMQHTVEKVDGATYGFELNANNYYESTNKGKPSSYSLCKLVFVTTEKIKTLQLECINSGESNYDFGILSNIDTTLSLSSSEDSSTNTYKSFKGKSSTKPVVITYPETTVGEHFIYIKYKKDSGGDNGNDSLQFKVIS